MGTAITYSPADMTVADNDSLFTELFQRLAGKGNGYGAAVAAPSVELAAFNDTRHVSFVFGRLILGANPGVEDAAHGYFWICLYASLSYSLFSFQDVHIDVLQSSSLSVPRQQRFREGHAHVVTTHVQH